MSEPAVIPPTSTHMESKSKKKKKSKKKGNNTPTATTQEAPAPPLDEPEPLTAEPSDESEHDDNDIKAPTASTDTSVDEEAIAKLTNGVHDTSISEDVTARFDALVNDREALRAEVTQLRQSLEDLQANHQNEVDAVQTQLQETQGEKEHAEEQYQNLLGKVNTIRSQLGERLKADAEELAHARVRIEELEDQQSSIQEQYTTRSSEVEELTNQIQEQSKELSTLRNRSNLSQQNWVKEKEELVESEAYVREEFENAKQAMHDWEVLAMEERTVRRDLADRVADLEEQLGAVRDSYDKVKDERNTQSSAVDGLQKAMQEIQTVRKTELKEIVETSQAELEALRKQLQELQDSTEKTTGDFEMSRKEMERLTPFEKEVKEKNLLIGKLRHEAVILNDHLTKALRFLKKGKAEDNVDRHIVTNHFLHFLALDRSDPKKFQVLQLIAALLGWSDEQKEQAGLSRPGSNALGAIGSARSLLSPSMHRTPSTPTLSHDYSLDASTSSPASNETLAALWQNFLEQEASSSAKAGSKPRTASQSTASGTPKG